MDSYANFFGDLSEFVWSPSIWLPPNVTWQDIDPRKKEGLTDFRHLVIPIPLAVLFLVLRYVLERHWISHLGVALGIKNTKYKKAAHNPILEQAYRKCKKLKHREVLMLSKQLDLSARQIERWWRDRHSQDKPSTLTKFCESGWRWTYYTYSFAYGLYALWDKPWLWNINECWYGYPYQVVTLDCWWYYMSSLAFYWSLAVSQFFDVKRKDFWQMFVHHIITICLLSFSWACNLHRCGTLVLLVHDCADTFLEAAKLAKYANFQKTCDYLFGIFTLVWIVTRLGIFPGWIIYSTSIEAPYIVAMFPAYYIFNGLLVMLLFLHVFWTYIILKIALKSLKAGQMEGDIRSSSSEEDMVELFHSADGDLVSTPEKKIAEKNIVEHEDGSMPSLINRFSREPSRTSNHEISSDSEMELTCESLNSSCTSELEITCENSNKSKQGVTETLNGIEFVANNMRM